MSAGSLIWKVLWRAAIVAVVYLAATWGPDVFQSDQKHYEVSTANTRVELQRNSTLHVTETLEFHFHAGSFSGAFRDIPLRDGAQISHIRVLENGKPYTPGANTRLGSSDAPDSFGVIGIRPGLDLPGGSSPCDPNAPCELIVWHYPQTSDQRTFTISYDVRNAITAYDDGLDVGWAVWGGQWNFWLDHLAAEIVTPNGTDPTHAWVSTFGNKDSKPSDGKRTLEADVSIGNGKATMSADRAEKAHNVIFRATVPPNAVRSTIGARHASGSINQVVAQEQKITDDESLVTKAENVVFDHAWAIFIAWTVIVVLLSMALAFLARERPTSVPKYVAEPPEDIPPALAYALATEGAYDDRIVLATLLSLVDRGYYATRTSQEADLDLLIKAADDRPPTDGLEEYEKTTMTFFDDLLGGEEIALSKMKDQIPEHSSTWRSRWEGLTSSLDQAEEGEINWDRNYTGLRLLLAVIALIGYGILAALYILRSGWIAIPAATTVAGMLFVYLLPATAYKRLDAADRERNARWASFRRWTDDFPRLDDDPPATLKLWRAILVYAVAFGTAERVAKSGRIPAPVGAEANDTGSWTAFALYGGVWSSDFNSFSSGFSSQVAPESSSSSGGFSGGGGGFSGGGGGGAW